MDERTDKIYFDTAQDLSGGLEEFYTHVLAEEVEPFALIPAYAAGFYAMLATLANNPGEWAKGQVTGPISFGLTVTDQNLRPSLYQEALVDVLVKNSAMNARWQIRQLRKVRPNVILVVDEPFMASFGSAFISLERPQAVAMLNEVFEAIHQEGALAGVHCCANTDWSVLLETNLDILNLDAYGYIQNLALYPEEFGAFIRRGGVVAWGAVINTPDIYQESAESIAERLLKGMNAIQQKAAAHGVEIPLSLLAMRSLLAPSCGLGTLNIETAERVLQVLEDAARVLRQLVF
jgi:methionine synthase II (cobalamin-independent)